MIKVTPNPDALIWRDDVFYYARQWPVLIVDLYGAVIGEVSTWRVGPGMLHYKLNGEGSNQFDIERKMREWEQQVAKQIADSNPPVDDSIGK